MASWTRRVRRNSNAISRVVVIARRLWRWKNRCAPLFSAAVFVNARRFRFARKSAHIWSLQPGHLTDVASTDQHMVKPWFNGKLDFSPPVKDFSDDGFSLIGGRLDVLGGQNVAV